MGPWTRATPNSRAALLYACFVLFSCQQESAVKIAFFGPESLVPAEIDGLRLTYEYFGGQESQWERIFYQLDSLPQNVVVHKGNRFDEGVRVWIDGFKGSELRMAKYVQALFPSRGIRLVNVYLEPGCLGRCLGGGEYCNASVCEPVTSPYVPDLDANTDPEADDIFDVDMDHDVPCMDRDESCNGVDDDCDGIIDDDYVPFTCGIGPCLAASTCSGGVEECTPGTPIADNDVTCDNVDDDCDGLTNEDYIPFTCGFGPCAAISMCIGGIEQCDPDTPLAEDDATCDDVDDDCDGILDEDYEGSCGVGACMRPSTCDEGVVTCIPGPENPEICDGIDNDCDGTVDDFIPSTCGLGVCQRDSICTSGTETCTPGSPTGPDDNCNGLDEDCDGTEDEQYVPYQCGVGACERTSTCDGGEDNCEPGTPAASDRTCDNVDEDCDGFTDEDYVPYQCGTGLCVANSVCTGGVATCTPLDPPVSEDMVCDNRDEDCDGSVDEDYRPYTCGLGVCERESTCVGGTVRCTEGPPTGGETTCNGLDDDCDGLTDEDYAPYQCGVGPCRTSSTCIGGTESCTPGTGSPEVCDGVDNDCNGEIDDTFPCRAGQTRNCTTSCGTTGEQTCNISCNWGTCVPPSETCNGIDDDCDITCDDGYQCCQGSSGSCTTSCGTTGSRICSSSCAWGSCTPPSEICNGADDDCDTICDNDWTCCQGSTGTCTTTCGSTGTRMCNSTCAWETCVPPLEICNGEDDDCDGTVDDVGGSISCGDGCCNGSETHSSCSEDCIWTMLIHSDRTGNFEICKLGVDGAYMIQLTDSPSEDMSARWSPDESKIAFFSDRDSGGLFDLYVMDSDGSNVQRLTTLAPPLGFNGLAWARDGSKIYFSHNCGEGCDRISSIQPDGTNFTTLLDTGGSFFEPDISPDNLTLLYVMSGPSSPPSREVYITPAATPGSTTTKLFLDPHASVDIRPRYSSEGFDIVWTHYAEDGSLNPQFSEIYSMLNDGTDVTRLTDNFPTIDSHPAYSPGGLSIAFSSNADGDYEVYIMDYNGTNLQKITENSSNEFVTDWWH